MSSILILSHIVSTANFAISYALYDQQDFFVFALTTSNHIFKIILARHGNKVTNF